MLQNTSDFLSTHYHRTERVLQKAITEWQMLSPSQMETTPNLGAWSAAQCLEHLNFYGKHYLPAIENAIKSARNSHPEAKIHPGWLGTWFTNLMLPQPDGNLKKKMQAPKAARPATQPDAHAVLAEFIDQQEKLLALLTAAASVNLNKIRVPTSLSSLLRLRLCDTFSFYIAHHERHVLQAERALAAALYAENRGVVSRK